MSASLSTSKMASLNTIHEAFQQGNMALLRSAIYCLCWAINISLLTERSTSDVTDLFLLLTERSTLDATDLFRS